MAEDEDIPEDTDMDADTGENPEGTEAAVEEVPVVIKPTRVSPVQWGVIAVLLMLLFGLFVVYPYFLADETQVLKNPTIYREHAREAFQQAYGEASFPRVDRINAFQDVIWNYQAIERAEAKLEVDDYFRYASAHQELAAAKYDMNPMAFVQPIRLYKKALNLMDELRHKSSSAQDETMRTDAQAELDRIRVSRERMRFNMGQCYLYLGNYSEATSQFSKLRDSLWYYQIWARRNQDGSLSEGEQPPVQLDTSPYALNLQKLYQAGLYLGQAAYRKGDRETASDALRGYLESTRLASLERNFTEQSIEADAEARYKALDLISRIFWEISREDYVHFKQIRGLYYPAALDENLSIPEVEKQKRLWHEHLQQGSKYAEEQMLPDYSVYDRGDVKLRLVEMNYHLGLYDKALEYCLEKSLTDTSKRNEMLLWKARLLLKKDPETPVGPTLASIAGAGDFVVDEVKSAALVVLGMTQISQGEPERPMGKLIPNQPLYRGSQLETGAFYRVAEEYGQQHIDQNPFVGKLEMLQQAFKLAMKAKAEGNLETSVILYSWIYENFAVPRGDLLLQIADLKRELGRQVLAQTETKRLSKKAREYFLEAARFSMRAKEEDLDPLVQENALAIAAESYYEGEYFSKAYDTYGLFLLERPSDKRGTRARYFRGLSALRIKKRADEPYDMRFQKAIREFIINMSSSVMNPDDNLGLAWDRIYKVQKNGETQYLPPGRIEDETGQLSFILDHGDGQSRDVWAYQSMLAAADTYYLQHKYNEARLIYENLLKDTAFSPDAEIWRKAAYQRALLSFDQASESIKEKPWPEAINRMEDVLERYREEVIYDKYGRDPQTSDMELLGEIRNDNTKLSLRLARAYLLKKEKLPEQTIAILENMLANPIAYPMSSDQQRQAHALLGDAYFKIGSYMVAYEAYRKAHDRWLQSYERAFYSLNMAKSLEQAGRRNEALIHYQRCRWEFENPQVFRDPENLLFDGNRRLDRNYWLKFVDDKIGELS